MPLLPDMPVADERPAAGGGRTRSAAAAEGSERALWPLAAYLGREFERAAELFGAANEGDCQDADEHAARAAMVAQFHKAIADSLATPQYISVARAARAPHPGGGSVDVLFGPPPHPRVVAQLLLSGCCRRGASAGTGMRPWTRLRAQAQRKQQRQQQR